VVRELEFHWQVTAVSVTQSVELQSVLPRRAVGDVTKGPKFMPLTETAKPTP